MSQTTGFIATMTSDPLMHMADAHECNRPCAVLSVWSRNTVSSQMIEVIAMEQVHHRTVSFTTMSSVASIEEEAKASETDVEGQLVDGGDLLKCFSPLLNSMRLFGLYFTRESRRIHDAATVATDSRKWNGGRIYAVVMMVLAWLNVARIFSVFHKTDKFGYLLFLKLSMVSAFLLSVVLQTACFVASQTGNLDRVFRDAKLPKSDHIRYRRLAVIHTAVCWILLVAEMLIFLVPVLLRDTYYDMSLTPLGVHVAVSHEPIVLITLFASFLYFFVYAAWIFSQSVNYVDYSKVLQCITYYMTSSKRVPLSSFCA